MASELKPCNWCGMSEQSCEDEACPQQANAVPDVPELVRWKLHTVGTPKMISNHDGDWCEYSQAAEIIAALDNRASVAEYKLNQAINFSLPMMQKRAEAAEAKLAQYEAQEPVMWLCAHDDRGSDRAITTSYPSRRDILKADGYEITPLYSAPLAPEGGKEC